MNPPIHRRSKKIIQGSETLKTALNTIEICKGVSFLPTHSTCPAHLILYLTSPIIFGNKRRGQVFSIPASCSGGSGFKSARKSAILTEVYRGFPESLKANAGTMS
jgi:hypothetical protein